MSHALTIAFEGSDGAGKATQTDKLAHYLQSKGKKVARVSFPRYTDTVGGKLLYEVLKSDRAGAYEFSKLDPCAASLLYAMDRKQSKAYLDGLIASNDVLIFDRYVESNLLHQGGKFKTEEARLSFARWLFNLEYGMLELPNPQIVVYLTIPFWLSRKRATLRAQAEGGQLDAVEKDVEYVKAGHDAGVFYARQYGWCVVDGLVKDRELSPDEVHEEVIKTLKL